MASIGGYHLVQKSPPFYIPNDYANYKLSTIVIPAGSLGVVKRFDSPGGAPSIVVKKFSAPFDSKERAKLVLRELHLLSGMHHRHVVRMLGKYTTDSRKENMQSIYHITQDCGIPLNLIIERGAYSMINVKKWTWELLSALQYIHSIGITHRNLHPGKMCIHPENSKLTLLGFGKARVVDPYSDNTLNIGHEEYMAIEMRFKWKGAYNEKVDIWSMAIIVCEMITGKSLFKEPGVKNAIQKIFEFCGPVEKEVLEEMRDDLERKTIEKASAGAEGKDFTELLRHRLVPGRAIKETHIIREQLLGDFIDRTLQFRASRRMTADQAIAHPFLSGIDAPIEQGLPDDEDEALKACRTYIWDEIKF